MKRGLLTIAILLSSYNLCFLQTKDINKDVIFTGLEETPAIDFSKIPNDLDYSEGFEEIELPHFQDLTIGKKFPPHLDQSKTSACTIFALSYALKTFQEAEDLSYDIYTKDGKIIDSLVFSPSYLFSLTKKGNNCKSGINLNQALLNLETYGTVSLKDFPYSENEVLEKCTEPDKALYGKGRINRIANFYVLSNSGKEKYNPEISDIITRIKKRIYNRHPVVFSSKYNNQFSTQQYSKWHPTDQAPIWDNTKSRIHEGKHAMLIVGYDDSINAFKVYNSWGKYGYIWMTYDLFKKLSTYEIYVAIDVPSKYHNNFLNNYASAKQNFDWNKYKSTGNKLKLSAGINEHSYIEDDVFKFANLKTDSYSKSVILGVEDKGMNGNMFKFIQNIGDTVQIEIGDHKYKFRVDSIGLFNMAFVHIEIETDMVYNSKEFHNKFPIKAQNLRGDRLGGKSFRFKDINVSLESNGDFKATALQTNNRWEGWHGKIIFKLWDKNGTILKIIETPSYGLNGTWDSKNKENKRNIYFETVITDKSTMNSIDKITIEPMLD